MPPSKKTIGLSELRVGLFIIGGIAVLIFLILSASGDLNPFKKKLRLKAQYTNASGLKPGADVFLAGVHVGTVEKVSLLPPSADPKAPKIEALLAIDTEIAGQPATERIRTDSLAQLVSSSLLGNEKTVNISPGTAAGQPVKEGSIIQANSAGGIDQFADTGTDLMKRLQAVSDQVNEIVRKINAGEGTMGRIINDESLFNNLNGTIRDAQAVIQQVKDGKGSAGLFVNDPKLYNDVDNVMVQLQSIADNIKKGKGTAGKLIYDEELYNNAKASMAKLDKSIDDINAVIADARAGKGTVGKLLTDEALYNDARATINRLNTTAERIDNLIAGAQRGEGTVGKLITDDSLYNNVNSLSSEGVKMLYDFRQNPKKYLTIKFQLF